MCAKAQMFFNVVADCLDFLRRCLRLHNDEHGCLSNPQFTVLCGRRVREALAPAFAPLSRFALFSTPFEAYPREITQLNKPRNAVGCDSELVIENGCLIHAFPVSLLG